MSKALAAGPLGHMAWALTTGGIRTAGFISSAKICSCKSGHVSHCERGSESYFSLITRRPVISFLFLRIDVRRNAASKEGRVNMTKHENDSF